MSCRHVYEGNIEIFRFCDVGLVACKVPHSSAQISIDPGSVCGGVVCVEVWCAEVWCDACNIKSKWFKSNVYCKLTLHCIQLRQHFALNYSN